MPDPSERMLFSVNEAARQLSTSRSRIYTLIADGSLRTVTLGQRQRITRDELARYVATLPQFTASVPEARQ